MSSQHAKRPLQPFKYARNGFVPDASWQNQLAEAVNAAVRWREKEVFRYTTPMATIPSVAGPGARGRWRFAFHTGPYAKHLKARVIMAPPAHASSGSPHARLIVVNSVGTEIGRMELHSGAADDATLDLPSELRERAGILTLAGSIVDLPTDTDLFGYWEDVDDGRLVACSVHETSSAPALKTNNALGTPVLDSDREDVATRLRELWLHSAYPLINWTVDVQTSPRTRISGAMANLIDPTVTGEPTAASPGWTVDRRNRSTSRRGNGVPVKFWIYASMSGGGGLINVSTDGDGPIIEEMSIDSSTPQWWSATASIGAVVDKIDISFAGDDVNTLSVYAACLWQYEA